MTTLFFSNTLIRKPQAIIILHTLNVIFVWRKEPRKIRLSPTFRQCTFPTHFPTIASFARPHFDHRTAWGNTSPETILSNTCYRHRLLVVCCSKCWIAMGLFHLWKDNGTEGKFVQTYREHTFPRGPCTCMLEQKTSIAEMQWQQGPQATCTTL